MAIIKIDRRARALNVGDEVWAWHNHMWHPGTVAERRVARVPTPPSGIYEQMARLRPEVANSYDYRIRLDGGVGAIWLMYFKPNQRPPAFNVAQQVAIETHGPLKKVGYGILQTHVVDAISMVGAGKLIAEVIRGQLAPPQASLAINIVSALWSIPVGVVGGAQLRAGLSEREYRRMLKSVTFTTAGVANIVSAATAIAANVGEAVAGQQSWIKAVGAVSTIGWTSTQICDFVNAFADALKIWSSKGTIAALKSPAFVDVVKTLITTAGGTATVVGAFTPLVAGAVVPAFGSAAFVGAVLQIAGGVVGGTFSTVSKKVKAD